MAAALDRTVTVVDSARRVVIGAWGDLASCVMTSYHLSCSLVFARLLVCLGVCLCAGGAAAQSADEDSRPPNIVFILADDLGWGDISIHGGEIPTPNIDRLFEQGIEFSNFMGWTVCSPTRAMFLTARHPFRLGLGPETGGELDTEETTIAEAFQEQGYRTGVFGKWHNGEVPNIPEYREAYSRAFSHKPDRQHTPGPGANVHGFDEAWVYYGGAGDHFTRKPRNNPRPVNWFHNNEYRPHDVGYTDDLITRHSLEFIRDNRHRPFFSYVSFHIIHTPLQAKAADIDRVAAAVTDEKKRLYGAMLLALDDNVRQLIDELESLGLDDNTIVIFSSDNGASLTGSNRPFRGKKGSLYEGGIRLPTAIRWPAGGLVGGQAWDGLWGFLDLFPTLMDMAGLPMPETRPLDGINVWPAIRERKTSPVESYYWAWRRNDAIRTSEWKLHRFFDRDELFDIRNDAGEQRNLATERPEVVAQLKGMMDSWASSTDAALSHRAPPAHLNSAPAPEGEVLEITVTVTGGARRGDRLVVPIAIFSGRQAPSDFIEYDVCAARDSLRKGFFYSPFRRSNKKITLEFRRGLGIDQFGREQATGPATQGGEGVWEHRVVGLLGDAPGPQPNHAMVFQSNQTGTFKIYIDNLRIRHVDGSTTPIWQDDSDTRFSLPSNIPPGFTEIGVRAVQLADLKTTIPAGIIEPAGPHVGHWIRDRIGVLLAIGFGALVAAIAYRTLKQGGTRHR